MLTSMLAPVAALLLASAPLAASGNPVAPADAGTILRQADTSLDAGNDVEARHLYEEVLRRFPGSPEAALAERSLKALSWRTTAPPPPPPPSAEPAPETSAPEPQKDVLLVKEPYSLKTRERLRLTSWEKVDFGSTAFIYGASVGFSYALALQASGTAAVILPTVLGSMIYTSLALAYLNFGDPDRGDLPLVLAITSYLPTTMTFALSAFDPTINAQLAGVLVGLAGTASVPIALLAARAYDLDPGDTQLVRDAGFWGMVLAMAGVAGFGHGAFGFAAWNDVSAGGLVGLYAGMGAGLLAVAFHADVSLERVRVTTWGGYAGAILGALLSLALETNPSGGQTGAPFDGGTVGAALGLAVTFAATGALDKIPEDAAMSRLTPTVIPIASSRESGMLFGVRSAF